MLDILDIYVHSRISKTHRLSYIIFGEVNFHILFQRDKLQLQRWQFFGKREDEGLFPGIVLCLICGFAAAFLSVVCESRINWRLFRDVFELCFPESYDKFLLHNKYIAGLKPIIYGLHQNTQKQQIKAI